MNGSIVDVKRVTQCDTSGSFGAINEIVSSILVNGHNVFVGQARAVSNSRARLDQELYNSLTSAILAVLFSQCTVGVSGKVLGTPAHASLGTAGGLASATTCTLFMTTSTAGVRIGGVGVFSGALPGVRRSEGVTRRLEEVDRFAGRRNSVCEKSYRNDVLDSHFATF